MRASFVSKTPDLTALRRDLHQHPELGFEEHRTKGVIAALLRDLGLEVHEGAGVVGLLRAGTSDRSIGLRADMDALPIAENTGHAYPSKRPGVMHACGHDGHMAMLLGAAAELAARPDFDGTAVFIFQPAEEHGKGAQTLLAEGLLTRFPLQEVYAIHNLPGTPLGQVLTRPGLICASESLFEINLTGQGGHSALPHMCRDALTIGAELVQALQLICARRLAPGSGAVLSVTEFLTDGQRNVLPGEVRLKGDVRARSAADRDLIESLMRQTARGIAGAHGAAAKLSFTTEFIETENAPEPTDAALRAARALDMTTLHPCAPMSFSEDFARLTAQVPGCFILLGNGTQGAHGQPLHAAEYDFNDDLLPIGAAFWAQLVRQQLPRA
ncbi:MAG: amidohydrolase [Pseudomonadota bacterium]